MNTILTTNNKKSTVWINLIVINLFFLATFFLNSCRKDDLKTVLLGQEYGGGLVIYVDSTGRHGLTASPAFLEQVPWSNGSNIDISTDWFDGQRNTERIVATHGAGNYAAYLCYQLEINGYSDWYLPSNDEAVYLLYLPEDQRFIIGGRKSCWTSTQINVEDAMQIDVDLGGNYQVHKQTPRYVHAIRKF